MIVCPTCSHQNPNGAATCSACGTSLVGLGSASGVKSYPLALSPGTKLQGGAFSIGRVLGQGGFGITYKGNDVNLGRLVAIKECFPDGAGRRGLQVVPPSNVAPGEWDLVKREFIEEARTVARFSHPGIVNVYSVFEENGTAYQAMEFLDGQSAGGLVEKGKLGEDEAVPIIERVADALETMHASGFIHRDLKPDNIVRTKDGRTVLIDFGTAKQFVREKTQKVNPVLTPGYAPLEQYSSQARFDHRLDIYALGATLYHLLTGEVPISAIERAAGVELSPVRAKNPAVSQGVSDAVERAMAIKVGERFDSVRDFARALREAKTSAPQAPRPNAPRANPPQVPAPQTPRPQAPAPQAPRPQTPAPRPQMPAPFRSPLQAAADALMERIQEGLSEAVQGDTAPPAPKPQPRPQDNPYLNEIRGLNNELQHPSAPPLFVGQTRLDELERVLRTLSAFAVPPAMACPACCENAVRTVSGNYSGACPFDGGALARIEWPVGGCPLCRQGTLQGQALSPAQFICGVCRRAPVARVERARLMGFVSVSEFECPFCRAAYTSAGAGAARLREVAAPFNSPLLGQTRGFSQWNEDAGATGNALDCSACAARFLEQAGGALLLSSWTVDPFGVGQNAGGQSAMPEHWAKIAAGATNEAATHRCPTCRSNWQLDLRAETLALVRAGQSEIERARGWGFAPASPYAIKKWLAKSSGKSSGEPGRVCAKCRSEFDFRSPEKWALVASPNPLLSARSTLVLTWDDWHRVGARLPLKDEEGLMRRETQTLSNARDIERSKHLAGVDARRHELNARLDALYKRAVVEGFVDLGLTSRGAKVGERVLWACSATSFKYRSRGGQTFWDSDELGRFVLSNSRVWLENRNAPKPRYLAEITGVEIQVQSRQPILALFLNSLQKPLGFSLDRPEIDVSIEGVARRITFDTPDVANMIRAQL